MSAHGAQPPSIEVTDLRKRYGRVEALVGLTMTVGRGEVFGFLGPNGAGKTTAVKLFLGLARPTGGQGRVLGARIGGLDVRRRIGYLPELFRYQPWLRAEEVLALHCELIGMVRSSWRSATGEALELVGLSARARDLVGGFSKGMQQRLGLGVALLGAPDLVILDEPTSALDPLGRREVREVIRTIRERGTTVFLNSHLLTEVERVCDRVAIVDQGRVIAQGPLDDLLGVPAARLRVTDLSAEGRATLTSFGAVAEDGEWLTISPLDPERVPEVVAAIVAAGGRIHAVEGGRSSLEDRFVGLLAAAREEGPT